MSLNTTGLDDTNLTDMQSSTGESQSPSMNMQEAAQRPAHDYNENFSDEPADSGDAGAVNSDDTPPEAGANHVSDEVPPAPTEEPVAETDTEPDPEPESGQLDIDSAEIMEAVAAAVEAAAASIGSDDYEDDASDEADVQAADTPEDSVEIEAATDVVDSDAPDDAEADATPEEATPESVRPAIDMSKRPKKGELVEGTITNTSPTQVTVDVGADVDGVISAAELEKMNRSDLESLTAGERVMVFVVNPRTHRGDILLSINRALEEMDWQQAEEYRQSKDIYESHIAGYNKGGLIVRFGRVRGFVPQSQISNDRRRETDGESPQDRWSAMVNEPIAVRVMEVDRSRNRLILSERAAARENREKRKQQLIQELTVGEIRQGRVVSLEDFGAFVDVGGAEGLVHLTELSWKHVTHPREILKIGESVEVKVISIDSDNKRIGLSLKQQEQDPWDLVAINYSVGQLVQGIVTKLTKFGAFARLVDLPEIEGLIHISELSDQRVAHPREVVSEDERLTLRVVKMDIPNRRLGLSLKKVNSAEYLDIDWSGGDESDG